MCTTLIDPTNQPFHTHAHITVMLFVLLGWAKPPSPPTMTGASVHSQYGYISLSTVGFLPQFNRTCECMFDLLFYSFHFFILFLLEHEKT
mgnify:CR=1 FL=1